MAVLLTARARRAGRFWLYHDGSIPDDGGI
jgi:hypothetical protein